jgi:hypothetical protein
MKNYWTVPEDWRGATAVCIGGGPSLTAAQVEVVRQARDTHRHLRVIAINDAWRLAGFADMLYFCDDKWWQWHHQKLAGWKGGIARLEGGKHDFGDPRIKVLRNVGRQGLSEERNGLANGQNSGYQAIGLAVHLGARRILLLGFDMQARVDAGIVKTHWFGDHPGGTSQDVYRTMLPNFESLPPALKKRGVEVVNCTPGSALRVFPQRAIEEALPREAAAA